MTRKQALIVFDTATVAFTVVAILYVLCGVAVRLRARLLQPT
jgi:hypothetical protein